MKRFRRRFKKTSGGVSEGQTSAALFHVLFPLAKPNIGHLFHFKFSFLVQGLAVGLDLLWGTDSPIRKRAFPSTQFWVWNQTCLSFNAALESCGNLRAAGCIFFQHKKRQNIAQNTYYNDMFNIRSGAWFLPATCQCPQRAASLKNFIES